MYLLKSLWRKFRNKSQKNQKLDKISLSFTLNKKKSNKQGSQKKTQHDQTIFLINLFAFFRFDIPRRKNQSLSLSQFGRSSILIN